MRAGWADPSSSWKSVVGAGSSWPILQTSGNNNARWQLPLFLSAPGCALLLGSFSSPLGFHHVDPAARGNAPQWRGATSWVGKRTGESKLFKNRKVPAE